MNAAQKRLAPAGSICFSDRRGHPQGDISFRFKRRLRMNNDQTNFSGSLNNNCDDRVTQRQALETNCSLNSRVTCPKVLARSATVSVLDKEGKILGIIRSNSNYDASFFMNQSMSGLEVNLSMLDRLWPDGGMFINVKFKTDRIFEPGIGFCR